MRAGSLDRSVRIDAYTAGEPDEYGGSTSAWTPFATLRAQLVSMTTEEYLRAYGEGSEAVLVFRTRYHPGITTAHRVTYDGRTLDIKDIKELGRRKGLELRCEDAKE
jgi:SPP1 family predicted phage head-tail adaptor